MRESVLWQLPPTNFASLNGTVCQKKKKREKNSDKIIWEASCIFFKNQCWALKDDCVWKMKLLGSIRALSSCCSHLTHTGREGIHEEVPPVFSSRSPQKEEAVKGEKKNISLWIFLREWFFQVNLRATSPDARHLIYTGTQTDTRK